MGAVVRYIVDGKPQWLAKISDQPGRYGYVPDRDRAHVFPTRDSAKSIAFAADQHYCQLHDVTIIPV